MSSWNKLFFAIVLFNLKTVLSQDEFSSSSSSYDSIVSSQCKAKCLSLYPWNFDFREEQVNKAKLRKRHEYQDSSSNLWTNILTKTSHSNQNDNNVIKTKTKRLRNFVNQDKHNHNHHFNVKWHKVMELCSKNTNCLQCSLPCEIPTNLLSNCKYLCKNNHPLCIESCNLLTRLHHEKSGTCPSLANTSPLHNHSPDVITQSCPTTNHVCNKDSDCADMTKCCNTSPTCPMTCQTTENPNSNLPSHPYNLTIVERKKGKTIILSWSCSYNKNKPTMFIVEGKYSLDSPPQDDERRMTKWGYLAQTVNNNWIILRSINRGRWYKFRVAAISKTGSLGYSAPTELFILSSAPKAPSRPQNLTVNKVYLSEDQQRGVNADLSWLPPKRSDLPITSYKLVWSTTQSNVRQHGGQDLIDAQSLNKYTIHNLEESKVYVLEITAQSKYEHDTVLSSSAVRVSLDTNGLKALDSSSDVLESYSLQLKGDVDNTNDFIHEGDEEEEDVSEEVEDDDVDASVVVMKPMTRNLEVLKRPVIKNLIVQPAYFQNGLVKAKLSWQVDYNKEASSLTPTKSSGSLLASTILTDQPMFTITWFAIKCSTTPSTLVTISQRQLPTPITATTINTHFEIYELKYNCDYVVNVRLAAVSSTASIEKSPLLPPAPQIAPAQFKVPACSQIKVIGRIQPLCYEAAVERPKTTVTTFYSIFSTTPSTTTIAPTDSPIRQLPRVFNIRYNIVKKSFHQNLYAVEFSWSMPDIDDDYTGYQISVVPKDIPGFGLTSETARISALVDKNEESFVVRQLKPSVKYIFQIQTVNKNDNVLGPANSLEFLIENEISWNRNVKSPSEMLLQMRIKDALKSTSKPISLNNNAVSCCGNDSSFSFFIKIVGFFLIGHCLKG